MTVGRMSVSVRGVGRWRRALASEVCLSRMSTAVWKVLWSVQYFHPFIEFFSSKNSTGESKVFASLVMEGV
jgi:hypothetical protein